MRSVNSRTSERSRSFRASSADPAVGQLATYREQLLTNHADSFNRHNPPILLIQPYPRKRVTASAIFIRDNVERLVLCKRQRTRDDRCRIMKIVS